MSSVNVNEQVNGEGHDLSKQEPNNIQDGHTEQKPKIKSQISMVDLERMVADSLKEIDVSDDDGNDDDDPDLLNELSHIIHPEQDQDTGPVDLSIAAMNSVPAVVPTLLKDRIEMYRIAEANANEANESSRARRFARGLSTLEAMLKEAMAGNRINMEEMPPEVITGVKDNPTPADK